ncbi:ATP-dependent DNA helicase RecQ [Bacillaceae bacterium IKA-2]|nr:ATP-dependent DNA helicase RecQ [Bacillaceae bacterium IKA-2]
MNLDKELFNHFKLASFRPGQKEIIIDLLNNHDVLAMLPTGSGKSICYQLPAFLLEGITIVVSPLLSLMEDQVQQLKSQGLKQVVAINSFLTPWERDRALEQLAKQKIVYLSPEILQSKSVMKRLSELTISLFVIDEAHCISQWGHEFRTDYLKLNNVRKKLGQPPCLAITATATEEVKRDIIDKLNLRDFKAHIYSIDRPNIAFSVCKSANSSSKKIAELVALVQDLQGPGLIYASTRKWTEKLATVLKSKGVNNVSYYHGGMENEDRLLIQQQFINDELSLICCTSAFGMGINKANIRYVIHFHAPLQMESYLQEIGRCGRDGKESIAITLYNEDESPLQVSLLTKDLPNEKQLNEVLYYLQLQEQGIRLNELRLIQETGITEIMWRFIRFHLEEQGRIIDQKYRITEVNQERSQQSIQKKINERIDYKLKKLTQFQAWLKQAESCRRELVLAQFDERLMKKSEKCCDKCGINIEDYYDKQPSVNKPLIRTWQGELKSLFE